ncbi:MAG: NfeD family protein [Ruminococcaceae bacterium]|nr:NfeD family protein [Oscillospiraceae bacterium]
MPYLWIALLVVSIVVEALTSDFVAIWFMPASVIAAVLALLRVPPYVQVMVFVLVGLALVIVPRPLCSKWKLSRECRTNVDAVIGERALVTEEISNTGERGEVKLKGLRWSARTVDPEITVPVGEQVEIVEVQGVKLIVKTLKTQ